MKRALGALFCAAWLTLIGGRSLAQDHDQTATAGLGEAGGSLSIRAIDDPDRPGTARRTVILLGANGVRRTIPLHDGWGRVGNAAINLFKVDQSHFRLVSERDCFDIDGVQARLTACPVRPPCRVASGEVFMGRFDYMNGFDPPHGRFRYRFRYLPSDDVACST